LNAGAWLGRLAIVAAIGGLLPLMARLWWGLELLAHFRLQYIALALPLALAALVIRRRLPALLLAIAIALNALPLLPYFPLPQESRDGVGFDVLNVNVNAGNRDRAAILGSIRAAEPDLALVVELTPEIDRALPALDDEYPHRLTMPATHNFGIGMLSRHPLAHARALSLSGAAAIDALVELPDGTVHFIGVHLAPPTSRERAATRNRQLDELAALAGRIDEPLIVCGDFNLTPYSPYFSRFARETGLRDTQSGLGPGFSWPTSMPLLGIPIDHCLVRGPIEAASVERMEPIGSDHYPVRVRFLWQTTQ
jgi:endonuclease/exonuclease/phosphatase (EEP) superfamily protein YafD